VRETFFSGVGRQNILVFVERRSMKYLEGITHGKRALRQFSQIRQVIGRELRHRPTSGSLCDGIEPVKIVNARDYLVVVSADSAAAIAATPFDGVPGIGIVSDNVATTHNRVVLAGCICQNSLQTFRICVDIAEN
jgi:hypothetical protein